MKYLETSLRYIENSLHILGCAALAVLAVLINTDILLRVFVGRSVGMQFELTELYLMPSIATLSLAWVYREGGHIALEVDVSRIFGRYRILVPIAIIVIAAVFFAAVCYASGFYAYEAFRRGSARFGYFDWPLGWAFLPVPIGTGVLTLRLIYDMVNRAVGIMMNNNSGGSNDEYQKN